jgi:hypothetical protein
MAQMCRLHGAVERGDCRGFRSRKRESEASVSFPGVLSVRVWKGFLVNYKLGLV